MDDAWFTMLADELSRLLVDARACAEACEAYLARHPERQTIDALAAPAAVSRILIELIDQPPQLLLAAVRLCRDLTGVAADELDGPPDIVAALRRVAGSASDLLEAAG